MQFLIIILFLTVTFTAVAADKPSMTSMWMELLFLVIMLVVLKLATFTNKVKFILFVTYILSGIITQTLWFPIILFIGLYVYFHKNNNDTYS
jgi:hypothetical protein